MIANSRDKEIIRKTINDACEKEIFRDKKIIIFGCTIFTRVIVDIFLEKGVDIYGIIDNNPQKINKYCMGVKIFSPNFLIEEDINNYFVLIASKYHSEMIGQLKKFGFTANNYLDIAVEESCTFSDGSEDELKRCIKDADKGAEKVEIIKRIYHGTQQIFLCPYPGTGDVYMACGFLHEYLKDKRINDYVLIVIGENCKRVADLFAVKNIECVTESEKNYILRAWEFYGAEIVAVKPLLHWGWRTKRYLFSNNHPQITFAEMFKYDVFNLSEDAEFTHPILTDDKQFAECLFERLGLIKGRTIIIAPYAGSFISQMSFGVWEKVVCLAKERGYTIGTNCYGEKEPVIKGTVPIRFPYDKAKTVLEYAGTFIGIRSGLCDVISSIKCKQIIIYEDGFNASDISYFGLKNMKININAIEIVYQGENIIDMILGEL